MSIPKWKEISKTYNRQDTKPYWYNTKPYQLKQNSDMTTRLLEGQDRMANTLHKVEQQSSIDCYITNLKLSLKFLYSLLLYTFSRNSLKEKMGGEFSKVSTVSHTSLANINCKHQSDEYLTSWCELLLQNFDILAEQCRDKLKIDLFSSQSLNEEIAKQVIRKHPKRVAHVFCIAKEGREFLIIYSLCKESTYTLDELAYHLHPLNGAEYLFPNHITQSNKGPNQK